MNYRQDNSKQGNTVEDIFYTYRLGAKPFLKWVGGKRQLIEKFEELYPEELKQKKIKNYYEPFVGGGAVFFDVAQAYEIQNAHLYDINDELILSYRVVQQNVHKLIESLHKFEKDYKKLSEQKQTDYYYEVRNQFNQERYTTNHSKYSDKWINRAAQLIFLNKTCFNGLFRFNSKGAFNTPQGRYKNPTILDEENLLNVSKLLEIATIKKADYTQVVHDISSQTSFVYFDPPYRPISKTSGFTSYSQFAFEDTQQIELATVFNSLHKKGHKLMLSNSDPKNTNPNDDFFDTIYSGFKIRRVDAKRSINSDANKRNSIKEIVVTNY